MCVLAFEELCSRLPTSSLCLFACLIDVVDMSFTHQVPAKVWKTMRDRLGSVALVHTYRSLWPATPTNQKFNFTHTNIFLQKNVRSKDSENKKNEFLS